MAFEIFIGSNRTPNTVSLRANGDMYIPLMHKKTVNDGKGNNVRVFIDKDECKIGFAFTDEKESTKDGIRKLTSQGQSGVIISVSAALRYMGIPKPKERTDLDFEVSDDKKMLIVKLAAVKEKRLQAVK